MTLNQKYDEAEDDENKRDVEGGVLNVAMLDAVMSAAVA